MEKQRLFYVTSESVTEGHPDKVCDQIADGILDAYLAQDPKSRVAVEVMASKNTVMLAGEITSRGQVDVVGKTREIIRRIGYVQHGKGFDADTCVILTNLHTQSPDISMGVTRSAEGQTEVLGGGDQGIMYGYACDETERLMPLPCDLANRLSMQLARVRKEKGAEFLFPDGKTQVTMAYNEAGEPVKIHSIVVSTQHCPKITPELLDRFIRQAVIDPIVDRKWMTEETVIHVNPTGRFVEGGPAADTGVTGRKLMVDTYGTIGRHGGGAFSGKDPTKVDRSAAYMARYVAKNIVASGLARKCQIEVAYAIGVAHPVSVLVDTYGTGTVDEEKLAQAVNRVFDLRPAKIIEKLDLLRPIYEQTAAYGHFGRTDIDLSWEHTDMVEALKAAL